MANKHQAVMNWLALCPLLTDTVLFNFLSERDGSVGLAPVATEKYLKQYLRGNGIKTYLFEVQAMFALSDTTDSVNVDAMQLMDTWRAWIDAQQAAQNFPDFGEECSGYRVYCQDSMASLAMSYESGFAKYRFPAIVQYYDNTQL